MGTGLVNGNQQQLWEYLLVACPDANVYDKVVGIKQSFFDAYKEKIAIRTKPLISVANFLARESMEETIIRYIHRICIQHKSFNVALNNFSGIPLHTIYARIQDHEPFQQLAYQLKVIDEYVRSNGCPAARLVFKPHLTIANGLDNDVYNKAMIDYSQKTLHETFLLTELVLLKRNNQFETCKQVNVFRFYPPDTNIYNAVA